ncbi:MAG: apolipoprotein N-acyltransferase [Rhodocyclaceae bacterium]|nr:apolipoprotein N-acyltransferase [Rhodocyclaceae bacterium]
MGATSACRAVIERSSFSHNFLAFFLGSASVAGFAPLELFPLPLLALAGLLRLWQVAPAPRGAAWLGFSWGLGFFLTGVSWVYVSLHDVGGMAAPLAVIATLLFCCWLALFPALVGYFYRRLASADFWRNALLFAGLWMLAEWLRGVLLTGFPWLALGYSQTPPSPLAGFAPVLGSYGIGLLAALIAAALAFGLRRRGAWLLILALFGSGALLRGMDWTQPVGAPVSVSLLQGNIPQSLKWTPERLPLSIETYTRLALENPAALTVLPETALPLFFHEVPREVLQALTQHGDVLVGMAVRHREGGYVNGAIAIQKDAVPPAPTLQSYAKQHLVPFGEYVPPGFAWFFGLVNIPMSDFSAGPARQAPLAIAGQQIAANICYEDLFGEEIIRSLPAATLLINLSNTAWFGDSLAQPQHLQIARLRALETGRMMLRATNTGITAAIAPDGRVLAALPAFTAGALQIEAQGFTGLTPYSRWGNALALLLAICACLPALIQAYRQRRSR